MKPGFLFFGFAANGGIVKVSGIIPVIVLCFLILSPCAAFSSDGKEAVKVYLDMRTAYGKWDDGLFGSRKYYKGRLVVYLNQKTGKRIETGFDFVPDMPGTLIRREMYSEFVFGKWLVIHGTPGRKSLEALKKKGIIYLRNIEKMKYLYSVSGTIRKFRLTELSGKRRIHLYLDDLEIESLKK